MASRCPRCGVEWHPEGTEAQAAAAERHRDRCVGDPDKTCPVSTCLEVLHLGSRWYMERHTKRWHPLWPEEGLQGGANEEAGNAHPALLALLERVKPDARREENRSTAFFSSPTSSRAPGGTTDPQLGPGQLVESPPQGDLDRGRADYEHSSPRSPPHFDDDTMDFPPCGAWRTPR